MIVHFNLTSRKTRVHTHPPSALTYVVTLFCGTFLWHDEHVRTSWCDALIKRLGPAGAETAATWRAVDYVKLGHNVTDHLTEVTCLVCIVRMANKGKD
jgi:hypothetical protein